MVFGFFIEKEKRFSFFFCYASYFVGLLFHVVRRHPGDVLGESGPQKAVEVLRNFIAIALK